MKIFSLIGSPARKAEAEALVKSEVASAISEAKTGDAISYLQLLEAVQEASHQEAPGMLTAWAMAVIAKANSAKKCNLKTPTQAELLKIVGNEIINAVAFKQGIQKMLSETAGEVQDDVARYSACGTKLQAILGAIESTAVKEFLKSLTSAQREHYEALRDFLREVEDSPLRIAIMKQAVEKVIAENKVQLAKAKQAKADQAKADQAKADQAKADQAKADQAKAKKEAESKNLRSKSFNGIGMVLAAIGFIIGAHFITSFVIPKEQITYIFGLTAKTMPTAPAFLVLVIAATLLFAWLMCKAYKNINALAVKAEEGKGLSLGAVAPAPEKASTLQISSKLFSCFPSCISRLGAKRRPPERERPRHSHQLNSIVRRPSGAHDETADENAITHTK